VATADRHAVAVPQQVAGDTAAGVEDQYYFACDMGCFVGHDASQPGSPLTAMCRGYGLIVN
jgi:hypothetical protein